MSDADRVPVLAVRDLCRVFRRKGFDDAEAVEGASFKVYAGECVGLVGESGSGKSTIARMVTRLIDVTSGQVLLCGRDITRVRGAKRRAVYESVQMVFQDLGGANIETDSTIVSGDDVTYPDVLRLTCEKLEEAAVALNITREPSTWKAEFDHLMSELKSLAHTREP